MSDPIDRAILAQEEAKIEYVWTLFGPSLMVRMYPEALLLALRNVNRAMAVKVNGQALGPLRHVYVPEVDAEAFYRVLL